MKIVSDDLVLVYDYLFQLLDCVLIHIVDLQEVFKLTFELVGL